MGREQVSASEGNAEAAAKAGEGKLPLPTIDDSDEDDVEAGPMLPKSTKRRKVTVNSVFRTIQHIRIPSMIGSV
jgi:hypothetical protein